MIYKECFICKLNLPISIIKFVQVKHKERILTLPVCELCKAKKEAEAKEK